MSSSAVVLGKTPASKEALLKDIQAAYLDNLVTTALDWRKLKTWLNDRCGTGQRSCTESFVRSELPELFLHSRSFSPSSDDWSYCEKWSSKLWSQDMYLSSQYGYLHLAFFIWLLCKVDSYPRGISIGDTTLPEPNKLSNYVSTSKVNVCILRHGGLWLNLF